MMGLSRQVRGMVGPIVMILALIMMPSGSREALLRKQLKNTPA
jgi:hypothetical protein